MSPSASSGHSVANAYGNEAHPDGNVTGFANWESSISGKWLEILKEVAPDVERVAFMMEPQTPILVGFFKSAEAAAPSLKVKLVPLMYVTQTKSSGAWRRSLSGACRGPRSNRRIAP
jgi:ABC-type uncharacterized transport system substrate-binding protein